jgi:hypothetical protein
MKLTTLFSVPSPVLLMIPLIKVSAADFQRRYCFPFCPVKACGRLLIVAANDTLHCNNRLIILEWQNQYDLLRKICSLSREH